MKQKRISLLKKLMKRRALDAVILTTGAYTDLNPNILYYTDFKGQGIFILKKNSSAPSLLVSAIESEKAKKTGAKTVIIKKEYRKEILKKELKNLKNIGIDKSSILLSQYEELRKIVSKQKAKFTDIGMDLLNIRAVKEKEETDSVKKACEVCDGIFSEIVKNFKFKTEKELASFIELKVKEKELENSFAPIVSSGKNSSDVHHVPSGRIEQGFLILDFGCKVNGYCSDMARTIYVGTPSEKEKNIYKKVFDVQENALKLAVIGKQCSAIHSFAATMLGDKFVHNLGHGVGLEIHEMPNLTPSSKTKLTENNIITIEPGIYEEGKYGIRIEDTVLVTKKGPVRLTKSSKELICIRR